METTRYRPIQMDYLSDPWRVLAVCVCLNLSHRQAVRNTIGTLFDKFPTARSMVGVSVRDVAAPLRATGLSLTKAERLIAMSAHYLQVDYLDYETVLSLPGCGLYAADAFAVFCQGDTEIHPADRVLAAFLEDGWDA